MKRTKLDILPRKQRSWFANLVSRREFPPSRLRKSIRRSRQAELQINLSCCAGNERPKQNSYYTTSLDKIIEHLVEPGRLCRIFRKIEWFRPVNILIQLHNQIHDHEQSGLKFVRFQQSLG